MIFYINVHKVIILSSYHFKSGIASGHHKNNDQNIWTKARNLRKSNIYCTKKLGKVAMSQNSIVLGQSHDKLAYFNINFDFSRGGRGAQAETPLKSPC